MNSLFGKVALITGASRGIGAATAQFFAKHGTNLILHGRDKAVLDSVAEKCADQNTNPNAKVTVVTGDLDKDQDETVSSIAKTVRGEFDHLDILFNNAGYKHPKDDTIHSGGDVIAMDAMYRILIRASYRIVQELVGDLEKTGNGVVINCSSTASTIAVPRMIGYCTHKAALDQMTKVMALSFCNKGIRVNAINPGYVYTSILTRVYGDAKINHFYSKMASKAPLGRKLTTPEEVAAVVGFLASDMAKAMTGQTLELDRGAGITNPQIDWTTL